MRDGFLPRGHLVGLFEGRIGAKFGVDCRVGGVVTGGRVGGAVTVTGGRVGGADCDVG